MQGGRGAAGPLACPAACRLAAVGGRDRSLRRAAACAAGAGWGMRAVGEGRVVAQALTEALLRV